MEPLEVLRGFHFASIEIHGKRISLIHFAGHRCFNLSVRGHLRLYDIYLARPLLDIQIERSNLTRNRKPNSLIKRSTHSPRRIKGSLLPSALTPSTSI